MSKRILLVSFLVLGFIFVATSAFAQALPSGYDGGYDESADTGAINPEAGSTFVQDLEEIRRRRIDDIIQKIRQGDPNVLRFIVYDVFEEVHREVIRRARAEESNFYEVLNNNNAIPAFIGGFDNQDPKVRLRCVGWLGDWVDEIGTDLADIQKRTRDRIASRIETREEVKFALRLLDLKIVRKTILNRVYQGDERVLETISADDFIVLIHDELFLRSVYCIPDTVHIRSIRLAPWWIDVKVLDAIVAQRLTLSQRMNETVYNQIYGANFGFDSSAFTTNTLLNREEEESEKLPDRRNILPVLTDGTDVYRIKTLDDNPNDGQEFEELKTYYYSQTGEMDFFHGYVDRARNWDIQSLYDLRYFNYSETGNVFDNEEKFVKALFGGLRNRHLVVRENCARILNMLSDPYIHTDLSNRTVGVDGIIAQLAEESKYVETAITAWQDVRYAQFVDVARPSLTDPNDPDTIIVYKYDGRNIGYFNNSNPWGYIWNYRNDVHELLRRMGLGKLFACDIAGKIVREEKPVVEENTYFVESLFDLTDIDVIDQEGNVFDLIPDWHGVDVIEDEIFGP